MGRPRIMLDVGYFQRKKIAALPWRRQLGHIYILTEAKQQDREGVFDSKAVLRVAAGVFRDAVDDLLQSGLLHDAAGLCDKCQAAFPDLEDGSIVVHDWHEYQVSRTTSWRLDRDAGETAVKQPGNIGETEVKPLSRARVTRFPVPSSETPTTTTTTEGVQGEPAVFAYLARHGAAIRPDSGFGLRLTRLMDRQGAAAVLAKAEAIGGPLSDRQWVFGLEAAMEAVPIPSDPRVAEREAAATARAAGRDARIWARRIEAFRAGGQWDEAWGDPPAAA